MKARLIGIAIGCMIATGCLLSTGCLLERLLPEQEAPTVADATQDLLDAIEDLFDDAGF